MENLDLIGSKDKPTDDAIRDLYSILEGFDWGYAYADTNAYFKGVDAMADLMYKVQEDASGLFRKMYEEYKSYVHSGPAFNIERLPKPELINYLSKG